MIPLHLYEIRGCGSYHAGEEHEYTNQKYISRKNGKMSFFLLFNLEDLVIEVKESINQDTVMI